MIVSRQLYFTINLEEILCFLQEKMPYLCGFWRFANAYLFSLEGINAYISKRDDGLTFSDVAVVVWADEKSIEAAMERGVQLIVTCGVSSKEAMKACSEHRAVLELPGETAAHIFETCVEQYLSEVLSSSIEILTIPMQRKSRFLKCRKE